MSRINAGRRPQRVPQADPAIRTCLGCGSPFKSAAVGNRICVACRARNAGLSKRGAAGPACVLDRDDQPDGPPSSESSRRAAC